MKWPNQCRNNEKLTIHDKSLRVGNQFHLHRIYTIGEKSNFMYKGIVVLTYVNLNGVLSFDIV